QAPGVDVAKWDWKDEEKRICDAYVSAVAKFDIRREMPGNVVSRETPKTTDSVAVKGAGIGAENVVQFAQKDRAKPRKPEQAAHIALAKAVLGVLENRGYRLLFTETGPYAYEAGLWTL